MITGTSLSSDTNLLNGAYPLGFLELDVDNNMVKLNYSKLNLSLFWYDFVY